MPYASRFLQVVVGGTLLAGTTDEDVWQFGLKVPFTGAAGAAPDEQTMEDALDDLEADVTTWWTAIRSSFAPQTIVDFCKINQVGTDGLYTDQNNSFRRDMAPQPGAAGEPLPADVALVVTLNTDVQRGLAAKGRIYLPSPSVGTVNDGRVAQNAIDAIGTATAAFIKNVGDFPGLDSGPFVDLGDVSVMSSIGAGTTRTVTSVRIGDLYDTQQRRSNRMREVYTSFALPS